MDKIDLVVPYVTSNDLNWINDFNLYNKDRVNEGINAKNRFRGQGEFFKYFFRCVEKNLPFINKIFLLVAYESQVPHWLNKDKVVIVTHDKFIPKEFLPTFNSTTIELFMWNIPGLSEHFLYTNDDTFVIRSLTKEDFFVEEHDRLILKTNCYETYYHKAQVWQNQCLNSQVAIDKSDRNSVILSGKVKAMAHSFRPYMKSEMEKCFKSLENPIITRFRSVDNLTVYVFDFWLIKYCSTEHSTIHNLTFNSSTNMHYIRPLLDSSNQIVCIQDTDEKVDIYNNHIINNWFREHFKEKSKFEK